MLGCKRVTFVRNIAFSLLMAWSLATSLCVVCPQMQALQTPPHDCCKPTHSAPCGHHDTQKTCPGHETAFEASSKLDVPAPANGAHLVAWADAPVSLELILAPEPNQLAGDLDHSPPERFLLNSVLLI